MAAAALSLQGSPHPWAVGSDSHLLPQQAVGGHFREQKESRQGARRWSSRLQSRMVRDAGEREGDGGTEVAGEGQERRQSRLRTRPGWEMKSLFHLQSNPRKSDTPAYASFL